MDGTFDRKSRGISFMNIGGAARKKSRWTWPGKTGLFQGLAYAFCMLGLMAQVVFPSERLQISGDNEIRYSITERLSNTERYFEDWTDVSLRYQNFTGNLVYEAHLPPEPSSRDTAGQGIYQRTLGFTYGNLAVKAGNYFAVLGNGLTFRSYKNRDIGWNTNIDGVSVHYASDRIDVKLLGGKPRDPAGRRYAPLQAGEIRLMPWDIFHAGITLVTTEIAAKTNDYWGSFYSGLDLPFGGLKMEFAARDFAGKDHNGGKLLGDYQKTFPAGKALYVSANAFAGPLSLLAEARHYQKFNLFNGAVYNNPPTVVREHLFSLLNKRQLVQNADDEKGYLLGAEYPILEDNILSLNYSRALSVEKELMLFEEWYGQWEYSLGEQLQGIAGSGLQKDLEGRHLNFVIHPVYPLNDMNTLKGEWQHQHTKIEATGRMFYSQFYSLSLERSPNLVLSWLMETSTDQLESSKLESGKLKFWTGLQVNWHFLERHDLAVFAGTRRKGKVCAGGVCVQKPALKGAEVKLTSRF